MARPPGGNYTEEKSRPVATRLPNDVYEKAVALAGTPHLTPWLRDLVEAAVAGKVTGTGALQSKGYKEGFRQGWAAANATFRKALGATLEEIGGMPK